MMYELMFATNATPAKVKAFFTTCDYDDNDFDENGRKVPVDNRQNFDLPTIDSKRWSFTWTACDPEHWTMSLVERVDHLF